MNAWDTEDGNRAIEVLDKEFLLDTLAVLEIAAKTLFVRGLWDKITAPHYRDAARGFLVGKFPALKIRAYNGGEWWDITLHPQDFTERPIVFEQAKDFDATLIAAVLAVEDPK